MSLCLRDGKVIWDTSSKVMLGEIFKKYLNVSKLTENYRNSNILASINNSKESNGIYNKIEELNQLKEDVINVYFNKEMVNNYYNIDSQSISK